jgi:epoxyqueuosine reductase
MRTRGELTSLIRHKALEIGFDACGFARARFLDEEAYRMDEWLAQQRHGSMDWMEHNIDKRLDPTLLVEDSKTVISVLASYWHPSHEKMIGDRKTPLIAKYAQGRDYHKVLKQKLKQLFAFIQAEVGEVNGRIFVDSAPVLDKKWAQLAGLGWIGKNSNLLNKKMGSFFLIGEIILDLELSYDAPQTDHCGSCTRCIEACPTDAIYEPDRVDASRCISYLTIEHKGDIDQKYHRDMQNWVFGCDICQDVCPWNSHARMGLFDDLHPREPVLNLSAEDLRGMQEEDFDLIFEGSPVKRTKYRGFLRNVEIVNRNLPD